MNKMSRAFNRYTLLVVLAVLLFATGVKVHSALAGPLPRDSNNRSLRQIDRGGDEFSFAVFGDNQNNVTVFNELVGSLNRQNVEFALGNGDLVLDGEKEMYRAFIEQVAPLKKPLLTAIGNHEVYSNGRGLYHDTFGPFYYSFAVGRSYFIVLDNSEEHRPERAQLAWLAAELEKSTAYRYRFVFMHVPLYDTRQTGFGLEHGMKNRGAARRINALLDRYDITMLFASHIHEFDRGTWGKTPYIITGGAGGELAGTDPGRNFFHYVRADVSKDGVEYKVVRLGTPRANILNRLVHDTWLHLYSLLATHYLGLVTVIAGFYIVAFVVYTLDRKEGGARQPGRRNGRGGAG